MLFHAVPKIAWSNINPLCDCVCLAGSYHFISDTEGRNSRAELRERLRETISCARGSVYDVIRPKQNTKKPSEEEQHSREYGCAMRVLPERLLIDGHGVQLRVFD